MTRSAEDQPGGAAVVESPAAVEPRPGGFDEAERIRARDPVTLQAVARTYLGQVLRAARAAGLPRDQAEDVTQATFTTFIEKAHEFEGRSHVRTWIFGILYRKIAEARRRQRRERDMAELDDVIESRFDPSGSWSRPPLPTDADVSNREIREAIADCLDAAPTAQRMAFVLREVEGLTTEEICKILGVTVTNLGVMMYRVRNRLRECLEIKGFERGGSEGHDADVSAGSERDRQR